MAGERRAPVLRLRGVRKTFGSELVLDGIDLDVYEGEVVVIIGPSGSGKTTLVRCIDQLESIDAGAMYLDDELLGFELVGGRLRPMSERSVNAQRRRMAMVFQQFNLFPHKKVIDNVTIGPIQSRGQVPADATRRARVLLERVGLGDKMQCYPRQLSGGQQQRVAIARALAMEPRIILFDEPTSALDAELVGEVLDVIQELAREGMTMIVVTHELRFAREVADRCVFMERGRIIEVGPPAQIFGQPRSERLRTFLSELQNLTGLDAGREDRHAVR
ncbi:MAG TPA: amino acid ABC transporter ATP-binding protein [Chloroflexota bacterium]|nr:amino acid ABC transporter ATP-binding protein [Chloroflexota bacterium]